MGHIINHTVYPEKVNKSKVQAEWDNEAAIEGRLEGCTGLYKNIRWIEKVCTNREAAEEYIRNHDSGWYDQLAVKFRDYSNIQPSKKLTTLREKCDELKNKLYIADKQLYTTTVKSKYVGCKGCGSKLAAEFIKTNNCPLCRTDLRSETTLKNLASIKSRIKKQEDLIRTEELAFQRKCESKATIKWLVKTEYHV